jgi:hypothetical protein
MKQDEAPYEQVKWLEREVSACIPERLSAFQAVQAIANNFCKNCQILLLFEKQCTLQMLFQ